MDIDRDKQAQLLELLHMLNICRAMAERQGDPFVLYLIGMAVEEMQSTAQSARSR